MWTLGVVWGRALPRANFYFSLRKGHSAVWSLAIYPGGHKMPHSDDIEKPSTTLPGKVQKVIKPIDPKAPEQAEIAVENAEELYREIRGKYSGEWKGRGG